MNNMNNLYYNNKKLKKIKNKRTKKVKKIWGWILSVIGGLDLISALGALDAGAIIGPLFFLVPGILLLLSARKQVATWDRYEAIIDNQGNTPISLIAKRMGFSTRRVYSDLQEMIVSDFFIGPNQNIEAYIDAERDMLVMTSGGRPLKPLPDLPPREDLENEAKEEARREQEMREAARKEAAQAAYEAESAEDFEEVELSDLERIREAITSTQDEEVRNYLYGLEGSVRRIDERLQTRPELKEKTSIKRLYKYYLPQILELIRKYKAPDTPADLKEQIRDALGTSASALANIEADLLERDQMDAEVDIEVLKNMFAQDGLLGRSGIGAAGAAQTAGAATAQTAGTAQAAGAAQTAGAAQAQRK